MGCRQPYRSLRTAGTNFSFSLAGWTRYVSQYHLTVSSINFRHVPQYGTPFRFFCLVVQNSISHASFGDASIVFSFSSGTAAGAA